MLPTNTAENCHARFGRVAGWLEPLQLESQAGTSTREERAALDVCSAAGPP